MLPAPIFSPTQRILDLANRTDLVSNAQNGKSRKPDNDREAISFWVGVGGGLNPKRTNL